jgi:hypothetical protein
MSCAVDKIRDNIHKSPSITILQEQDAYVHNAKDGTEVRTGCKIQGGGVELSVYICWMSNCWAMQIV